MSTILRLKRFVFLCTVITMASIALSCSENKEEPAGEAPAVDTVEISVANTTDANAALVEGSRLLDENQTERAIEFLEHAVSLNPDLAEAHFKLGIAYSLL